MSIQRYPYDKNNVKEINLPTTRWSPQCPICKLLRNSRKRLWGEQCFNVQLSSDGISTEFPAPQSLCSNVFQTTISIFSHNIRCNTLWKTTLAAWKTTHTWTYMLLLLSISKLSQITWPDQQRFAKISLLFFSPCCSSFSPPIGLQKLPSPIYLTDGDRSSITRFNLSTN